MTNKNSNSDTGHKKYISYFQETNSYGVMTVAKSPEEAAKKAAEELRDMVSKKVYLHKIPLTHVQTDVWNPDIDIEIESTVSDSDVPYLKYTIEPNSNFSELVGEYCNKRIEDLTDKDFEGFFMDCTNEFIEKGTKWVERTTSKKIDRMEEVTK